MKYDDQMEVGKLFEKYRFQVKYDDRYWIKVERLFEKYRFQVKHDDQMLENYSKNIKIFQLKYNDWYRIEVGRFRGNIMIDIEFDRLFRLDKSLLEDSKWNRIE